MIGDTKNQHWRTIDGREKVKIPQLWIAEQIAKLQTKQAGTLLTAYRCATCNFFHTGKVRRHRIQEYPAALLLHGNRKMRDTFP